MTDDITPPRLLALLITAGVLYLGGCGASEADGPGDTEEAPAEQVEQKDLREALPPAPDESFEPGLAVFARVCAHCHIESEYAPTITDTRDWKRRYARADDGLEALYDHALNGFGDMLAKGGKRGKDLTDEQVRAAVDYAVAVTGAAEPADE